MDSIFRNFPEQGMVLRAVVQEPLDIENDIIEFNTVIREYEDMAHDKVYVQSEYGGCILLSTSATKQLKM